MLNHVAIYPASHYVTTKDKMDKAIQEIRRELEEQVASTSQSNDKLVEAQRIRQRTDVRHGDDGGAGLLLRHRELLPHHLRPARRAPRP